MYCPQCAAQAAADQKFCRSCGLNLELHAQILAGRPPVAEPDTTRVEMVEQHQNRRRKLLRWGFITLGAGLMVGLLLTLVGDAIENFDMTVGNFIRELGPIGGLIFVAGLSIIIYSRFLPQASAGRQWPQATVLPQATPTTKLPPERRPEPMPSVTEHTTELLETTETQPSARDRAPQGE